jgi:hypothetical protein
MAAPAFAALESRLASATMGALANITLAKGAAVVEAILDRSVETLGEYGLTGERRDRIILLRGDASGWAVGDAIAADPATYSAAELTAMGKSSWKLDRIAADDGHTVSWWLK